MGAPNHSEGRRIVPTMSQVLSSLQYINFRKTSGSNMGRQSCFFSRAPSHLVTPLEPILAKHVGAAVTETLYIEMLYQPMQQVRASSRAVHCILKKRS